MHLCSSSVLELVSGSSPWILNQRSLQNVKPQYLSLFPGFRISSMVYSRLMAPDKRQPVPDMAQSLILPGDFFCPSAFGSVLTDCTVMNLRRPMSLYSLLLVEDSPASVHIMNSSISMRSAIICSVGRRVACSLVLPGLMLKASGRPSASIKIPIWTIGVRRFSFEAPGRFNSVCLSDSKKKFVQS